METAVYGITVVLTIIWSVWNDAVWKTSAGLPEGSPVRMLNVAGPSIYFLFTALSGWQLGSALRLDLVGLLVLDILIILLSLSLAVVLRLSPGKRKTGYLWILSLYNVTALSTVVFCQTAAQSPLTLIRVSAFFEDFREVDIFSIVWAGVEDENGGRDLAGLLNKMIIALFSYIPVSLLRFAAAAKQKQRLLKELGVLSSRIHALEDTVRSMEGRWEKRSDI